MRPRVPYLCLATCAALSATLVMKFSTMCSTTSLAWALRRKFGSTSRINDSRRALSLSLHTHTPYGYTGRHGGAYLTLSMSILHPQQDKLYF